MMSATLRRFVCFLFVTSSLRAGIQVAADQRTDVDDPGALESMATEQDQQRQQQGSANLDSLSAEELSRGLGLEPDKRAFDRISGMSTLGGFAKKSFDRIGGVSSLGGFQRRAFDRIGSQSSLEGFNKKSTVDGFDESDDEETVSDAAAQQKRTFDRIGGMSSLGGLNNKRTFDRISGVSTLGGLGGKRAFDRIGGVSALGGFQKRRYDRISSMSGLGGGFAKKSSS